MLKNRNQFSVQNRFLLLFVVVTSLALVALCSFSVGGTRGTDQYWYIADTETLMRGDLPVTNFRFPGMLLRENSSDPITHFVHNGPILHLNSYIATFLNTSANSAWELSNLIWWVGAAILLFFTLRNFVVVQLAALGSLLYLTTPIVVWQAANFLQEMWLGFLASIFLFYACSLNKEKIYNWGLVGFVVIGAFSHPFFVLASVYLIGASLYYRKHYAFIASMVVALLLALLFKGSIFPSSFPPDLKSIVTSAVPGETNLHWQFDNKPVPITLELIGAKISEALNKQFFKAATIPLTMVVNLGMLALLVLIFLRKFRLDRILFFTLFSTGAWWAMVVLLQNQPRYQLLILPALIVCIILALREFAQPKALVKLLVACTVIFFVADVNVLLKVRADTHTEQQRRQSVNTVLTNLPLDARYAVVDQSRGLTKQVITQLSPAVGLMVDPRYIGEGSLTKVLALFKPDYVITSMAELPIGFANFKPIFSDSDSDALIVVYQVSAN